MAKKFRVVQVGMCHEHADGKIFTLKEFYNEFEIVGIVDDRNSKTPRRERTDNYKPFDGVPRITEEEALSDPTVEGILIEPTNEDLVPFARRAVERGFNIHMDKPTGQKLEPFIDLVEYCRAKNIFLQLGYMFQGNPAVKFIQNFVCNGGIGDVISAEADMNHCYGDAQYDEYLSTFQGGIIYNLGCHLLDAIMPMMPGLPTRTHQIFLEGPGDLKGCANTAVSILEWPHATVTLHASSHAKGSHFVRRLRIIGTKGWMEVCPIERFDGKPLVCEMYISEAFGGYPAGRNRIEFAPQYDRYIEQLREFVKVVRGEIPNPNNYDRDILVHKAVRMASGLK